MERGLGQELGQCKVDERLLQKGPAPREGCCCHEARALQARIEALRVLCEGGASTATLLRTINATEIF